MGPSASERCAGSGGARRLGAAPNAVPTKGAVAGIRGRGTGRGDALPDPALAWTPVHPSVLGSPRCLAGGEQKSGSAPRAPPGRRAGTPEAGGAQVGGLGGGARAGSGRAVAPPGLQAALRRGRGRRRKEEPLRPRARLLRAMAPARVLSRLLSAGEHVGDPARPGPARPLPGTWGRERGGRTRAPRVRSSLSPQASGPGRSGCPSSRRRPRG